MSERQPFFDPETKVRIIDYSMEVEGLATPDEVLNRLDDIVSEKNAIRVQGANRFSVKVGDWRRIELGKNVFVHRDVPRGWVEEWQRVCCEWPSGGAHDRKDVPCPVHMDRALENA